MTAMRFIFVRSSGSTSVVFQKHDGFARDFERERLVLGRVVFGNWNFRVRNFLRRVEQSRDGSVLSNRRETAVSISFSEIKPIFTARVKRIVIRAAAQIIAGLHGIRRRFLG